MADRSVSISLRARVGDYIAGMRQAKGETTDLGRKMVETGASADRMRRRLEAATKALPKIEIDADSSDAERKFAELRRELESLSSKRIGIDVSSDEARAEIQRIERELQQLQLNEANVEVRADIGEAITQLRAVNSEVSRVDGQTAHVRVDADVSGALSSIAMVGAALASIPVATTVGIMGAAFGAAGAGAAGFAAVAIPALGRVNDALKEQASSAGSAGAAGESLAQKQAKSAATALQMAQAQDRVRDAHAAVKQVQEQVTIAVEQAAERQESATRRVQDAEYAVADAHRATQRALEDLSRAREDAREKLEDLALATERGALSEERAQLNIIRAQQDLARANADPKATGVDKQDAALRVKEAELALKEIRERNGDLAKEQADAAAKGVEGSDQVKRAKENVESATRREQDAERDLKDARTEAAKVAIQGQQSIAKAQAAVIKAQRDAERAAQQLKVQQLQAKAALEGAGGAAGGAASKMSELSKAEKALAKDIKGYQDAYVEWQRSLEGDVFPAISAGLKLVQSQLPRISPLVKTAGRSFLDLEKDAAAALEAPFWDEFLKDLEEAMPGAIEGFGHSAMNVMTGLAGVFDAFLPHTQNVVDSIEEATKRFADWGTSLRTNPAFQEFLAYVSANAPKVMGIIGDLATTIGNLLKAGAGTGADTLDLIAGLADRLAHMSPEQMQAIALGVGAIVGAAKAGTALKLGAFVLLADVLSKMSPGQIQAVALAISGVVLAVKGYQTVTGVAEWWGNLRGGIKGAGDEAGTAKGKFSGLKDVLTGGGGMALAITGVITAAGALDKSLSGLNPNMDNLARHLGDFAKGGKPAADVLDQLGGSISLIDGRGLQDVSDVIERMTSNKWFDQLDTQMGDFANTVGGVVGVTMDHGAQRVQNLDQALSTMVTSGNAAGAAKLFDAITKQARDAGVPVEKLKDLFPQYTSAVSGAVQPTQGAAGAISDADKAMQGFQSTMSVFTARTDLAAAMQGLKRDFDNAKTAIEQAGGKLDFTAGMTDKQRDAVIKARGEFAGYLTKVQEIARGQADLATKTGNAATAQDRQKLAILEAAPKMFDLAGGSKEARDAIFKLGESAGLSRTQLMHAKDEVAKLRLEISRLQNKTITITATVKGDNSTSIGAGKALHEAGAIERYATGGLRSTPPGIAARPTILYGEGRAAEAFIPYERRYRDRAEKLLSQVASDFGMQVVPAAGSASQLPASTAGGGQAGEIRIVLDPLTQATDNLGRVVARGVTDAAGEAAGTADQLGSTLESAIADLGSQISALSGSVQALASSVGQAAAAGSAAAGSAGSSGSSGKASGAPGLVAPSGPSKAKASTSSKTKMGTASGGLQQVASAKPVVITPMADGGLVTSPTILAGEAGREMVVPIDRRARGRETLHQAATMLGYQMMPGRSLTAPRYSTGGSSGFAQEVRELRQALAQLARTAPGGQGYGLRQGVSGGVHIDMSNSVIREDADISRLGAELGFHLRDRG